MRIFIWHGYLLGGTGSNVYTRQLAREWQHEGHDVTVFCQEPSPETFDLGGARTVRPDEGGLLPVFVMDRYEGYDVRLVQDVPKPDLDRWVQSNAACLRQYGPADFVFANHVLLGGPVGAASGLPYIVKAHGSELEYSMRGNPGLSAWGAKALSGDIATVAGSAHIREVLRDVCGVVDRVHEIPPGVDVDAWRPEPFQEALEALVRESRQDPPNLQNVNERLPDEGNAKRLAVLGQRDKPTIVYFGKLIENKGVQVLLDAVRELNVRLVIVGFGDFRPVLEEQAAGLDAIFTGPLEHRHLSHLLALADVAVVPSIFPEAFGMVAAEAAAAGCPPLVADHSGLGEIARGLEQLYPPDLADLGSFTSADTASLRDRLTRLLALSPEQRGQLRAAARKAAVEYWSWNSVAHRILALV